ncbi:carbon monoxide dehydrogenase subunit G [Arthrobacter silviterrae]|uniref:SRPBCC family protein n=1 Tax=Arthrobacter silviterrae TaxID=2026658 RepID=A0ABX0DI98_9MICC|nr:MULTISPECIES: SRPBCC family protein [Arthrobacter]MCU6480000.1 SRPBCC family protein [Arthrobacter sp. A2-55]MDQ0276017.1 carbon monoxide dehydrogenase subunit G [Arthrobacter silviterrae]NGN84350.1 SRPBCC family protein [Arthrobacter silviterrae]
MELKHHFTVPSSLAETWHSFNQLEDIAPCFPGAVLTSVEGDAFTGTVKVKLGPIAMMYAGTGQFLSRDDATHTVVIEAQGKDKRGNGTAGATVTAVLSDDGGGGTTVDVSTDMNVTGKPAQFGRGVIQDISDKLLEQFVQCVIGKAGQAAEPPESEPTEPPEFEPPEPAEFEPPEPAGAGTDTPKAAAPKPAAKHLPPAAPAAELDLGAAVWPVLAKRFAPALLGILGALALAVCVARRKRRRG